MGNKIEGTNTEILLGKVTNKSRNGRIRFCSRSISTTKI